MTLLETIAKSTPRTWVGASIVAGVVSGVLAGVGTYRASPSASAWAWGLYVGFLAATFIAILWYALLTFGMALTANEQTRLSRQMFEAGHRPSIEVVLVPGEMRFYENEDNYVFHFDLYNHGSVPAVLAEWQGRVRRNAVVEVEGPLRDAGRTVFPTRQVHFHFSNAPRGSPGPAVPNVEIEITVHYHAPSVPEVVYTTRMVTSQADNWLGRFPEIT
jgi:hypothetical protein